jgi:hypothetical protein
VREADHSPPSSVEFKNAWSYTSTPPIRLHAVVLKDRDNFTFFTFLPFTSSVHFFKTASENINAKITLEILTLIPRRILPEEKKKWKEIKRKRKEKCETDCKKKKERNEREKERRNRTDVFSHRFSDLQKKKKKKKKLLIILNCTRTTGVRKVSTSRHRAETQMKFGSSVVNFVAAGSCGITAWCVLDGFMRNVVKQMM